MDYRMRRISAASAKHGMKNATTVKKDTRSAPYMAFTIAEAR